MNHGRLVFTLVAVSLLFACRERDKKKFIVKNSSPNESEISYYGTWERPCTKTGSYDSYSKIKLILKKVNGLDSYRMSTEVYSDKECIQADLFRHEVGTFVADNPNREGDFPLTMKVDKVFAVPHTIDRVEDFKINNTCKTPAIQIAKPVLCMDDDVLQGSEYEILVGVTPGRFIEWAGSKGIPRPESLKSVSAMRMNAADDEDIGF